MALYRKLLWFMNVPFLCALLMVGGCIKNERSEEAFINGTKFEFEVFSQQTLETTKRFRIISMTNFGTDSPSILVSGGSTEFGFFPLDSTILSGTPYTIIDTVKRGPDYAPPTQRPYTLYLDPSRFYEREYHTIVDFAKENYAKPDHENKLLQWLNAEVVGLNEGDVYFTVYAIVYQKLSAFEPEYISPDGNDWLRLQVNNKLFMHELQKDGLASEGDFGFLLKSDTLFYPSYERRSRVDSLLAYQKNDGTTFRSRVKAIIAADLK